MHYVIWSKAMGAGNRGAPLCIKPSVEAHLHPHLCPRL